MISFFKKLNDNVKNVSLYRSFISNSSILWYKTEEFGWLTAKEFYFKMVADEKITILKHELYL